MKRIKIIMLAISLISLGISSCGGESDKKIEETQKPEVNNVEEVSNPLENKGIGPITEIKLDPKIDDKMAADGQKIYREKCSSCHREYSKYIGPAPAGIMKRRSPEWIMNMILNPEVMVKMDPIAKGLIKQYASPMANQHLTQEEARKVLEYFRTLKDN